MSRLRRAAIELITIGEAFHRLDQPLIAERTPAWLAPGRCLATLGCFSLLAGQEPWHDVLRAAVGPWTDQRRTAAQPTSPQALAPQTRGADHERGVLTSHGFEHVGTFEFPHPHVWTVDSILGNLRSTARFSSRALGNGAERFDAGVRRALLAFDSERSLPGDAPVRLQPIQEAGTPELARRPRAHEVAPDHPGVAGDATATGDQCGQPSNPSFWVNFVRSEPSEPITKISWLPMTSEWNAM